MSAAFEPESRAVDRTRIFENASIVLPAAVQIGWIAVSGDRIVEVGEGQAPERGLDCAGDFLVPGLVDLHTDHLENHLQPRPKVAWPPLASVVAYDAQIAASAITTVFDSVRVGTDLAYRSVTAELRAILDAIEAARAQDLLRAEHRLHVRCEICAEDVVEQTGWLLDVYDAKLISLMDHTPGARQFCDLGAWKTYYGGKSGLPVSELERFMHTRRAQFAANYVRHRAVLVALAKAHRIVTASHDDATLAHVEEAVAEGAAIARISDDGRSRRGLPSRRRCRANGRPERGKGRLPLRQRGRRGAGAGRRARYPVFRLRAGKSADGRIRAGTAYRGLWFAGRPSHGYASPGTGRWAERSRTDRSGAARGSGACSYCGRPSRCT
jgi:hypothetical protein